MKHSFLKRQQLIRQIKAQFTQELAEALNLAEVQAPLLSECGTGVQDELSGKEQSVKVAIKAIPNKTYEVVHSLAKWKRQVLGEYGFSEGEGILTHMKALRPDEEILGQKHSVYVDQWDWEKVITDKQRSVGYLKHTVGLIYSALLNTIERIPDIRAVGTALPKKVYFIHSETLAQQYPELSPKQRERAITQTHGAVFIIGIGARLSDGKPHDMRAPDYDDWSSIAETGETGLNGDLLVWHEAIDDALELSSMGIRVDKKSLQRQLELSHVPSKATLPWHRSLLEGKLPLTVGGGIGQSRVAMFLMQENHIAKVQTSVWPDDVQQSVKPPLEFKQAMPI
ncbi:aspartate--ammonia ligase [Idiomarina piscisalsi]|uniref:aspartate--ammonia ligase n=1 Tax=Idiomarina piscisalsi TaxID=1096243 RepID=UPI00138632E1|nr:aspartate--ammonia ligase [Idiomarina piscisalsi]MTJ01308.1 aspartate--ammonia ligase [Idiomarina piscisalsi]